MKIDTLTLSLVFGLINLLLAIILGVFYQKDKIFRGFGWWIIGISLLGLSFIVLFVGNFLAVDFLFNLAFNILLVASSLALYYGVLHFFDEQGLFKNFLIFSAIYSAVILVSSLLGTHTLSIAVSALSTAGFAALNARQIYLHKKQEHQAFSLFFASTFFIHTIYFSVMGLLLILPEWFVTPAVFNNLELLSYFVISINSILWTFGFVMLMSQRLAKDTGEAREIYNLAFNTIPDAVLITRLSDGQIIKVNDGFTKLTGYSKEEVDGKTTVDINVWCEPLQRQKYATLLDQTGAVENLEFEFRRKNSKPMIGLVSGRTFRMNDEAHILNIVRDNTSRKKMEEKLRENEEKYRFMAENSADVIWHINKSYRIDYISAADERIRGFKREQVIGQPIWSMFKPEGIQLVRDKVEHHRQVEQVGNNMNTTRFEIEQRCKDGTWVWTEITAAPHYDRFKNLIGFHGISRDISERKRLLEKLHRQATIDELTQIPNRRYFMTLAEKELARAKRYHHPLSIIVADFDKLKKINDTYGHLAGDRALSVFSKIVKTLIRDVDILGRFGGDEFLLLLPETDEEQAMRVVERINQMLAASPVIYGQEQINISVSSGVASINDWTDTLEDLLNRADEGLYGAKRNRISEYSPFADKPD